MSWIFAFFFLLHNNSFAQSDLLDVQKEVSLEAASASQAREKAIQMVLEETVEKFGTDLLGAKKFAQHQQQIKLLSNRESGKFAPVQRADIANQTSPYTVSVSLKISAQNLRVLFEKAGILTSKFDTGQVLTFITFVDQVRARALKWWIAEGSQDDFLLKLNRHLHSKLSKSLRKSNFYVIDPVEWKYRNLLPVEFQKDYFRKDDYLSFETQTKMPLMIRGQVDVGANPKTSNSYRVQVRLTAILNSQGKVAAETSRTLDTEPGEMQSVISKNTENIFQEAVNDLSDQLSTALQKGVLESSMIKLALTGDLTFSNIENFKSTLMKNIGNIRYMNERIIESDKRIYEIDYAGSPEDLSKRIEKLKFSGFQTKVRDVSSQSIDIQIRK